MKTMIILLMVLCSTATGLACDICGCGVGNYYLGILPEFSKKIIGLRYRSNTLYTHIGAGGVSTYLTNKERYRTAELWAGWTINKAIRLMAAVPVNFFDKQTGLGDIGLQGYYQLFNYRHTLHQKLLVQSLWVGAGIKLPTGRYQAEAKSTANLDQSGSGSTDFTVNAMYDLRWQDAGLSTSLSYKMNTANKEAYRYGNKLSANAQLYHKFKVEQCTIAPNTGITYESATQDKDQQYLVDVSGGHVLLGTIGVETSLKRFAVGANWQTPLLQHLANGFVKANNRAMVHVAILF